MACPGQGSWWDQLFTLALQFAGAPASANNVAILNRWAPYECTAASFNPLATTSFEPNSGCFNSVCVRNYPDITTGAHGTATTWMNGYYPALLAALRRDAPLTDWSCTPIPAELDLWGTHGFATLLRNLNGCGAPCPAGCTGTPPYCSCPGPIVCPPGWTLQGDVCVPPPPPPPVAGSSLPALLLIAAAGAAVGVHELHRHGHTVGDYVHLSGAQPSRGPRSHLDPLRAIRPRGFAD